ncbi:MAG: hypothetical protein ACLFP2_05180 [Candidatus Woesearchaeota archaeon]
MKNKKENLRKKMHNGIDSMMDKAESIGQSSKKKKDYLKERSLMMKDYANRYIQEHPERSILISTGVGIVAGATLAKTLIKRKGIA